MNPRRSGVGIVINTSDSTSGTGSEFSPGNARRYIFPAPDEIPNTTIQTAAGELNKIVGTDTDFPSQAFPGDYIYDYDSGEFHKVFSINAPDDLRLAEPFSSDVAETYFMLIRNGNRRFSRIIIENIGDQPGSIFLPGQQAATIPAGKSIELFDENGLAPVVVDTVNDATTFLITLMS